jgi:hypothetical protein
VLTDGGLVRERGLSRLRRRIGARPGRRGRPRAAYALPATATASAAAIAAPQSRALVYPERHYRDVLCSRVHTPQDDSVVAAAGQSALAAARDGLSLVS